MATHNNKFKTHYNADQFPPGTEKPKGKSMTVPDQSMSIATILKRYASGLGYDGVKMALYDEEDTMPDPRTLDLAEREQMMSDVKEEINAIQSHHKRKKEAKNQDSSITDIETMP